jgi:tRNA pseudouridine32 synthase / 23S rRNA pseudouridine746 synthase
MPCNGSPHPLSDFLDPDDCSFRSADVSNNAPTYWYQGCCAQGNLLRLPRTAGVEAIAHGLMQQLAIDPSYAREGKMYGVLLVKTPMGQRQVLKAFSGLLQGTSDVEGWVPPIPGRDRVAVEEAHTLTRLESIKQELIRLQQIPERQHYQDCAQQWADCLDQLTLCHRQRKQERQQQRQNLSHLHLSGKALAVALHELDDQSRQDGIDRRRLKQKWDDWLRPLQQQIEQADAQIRELKQQRKLLSRQLQTQMHAVYCLTNFGGESLPLQQLMPDGMIPTGTGDCCAPKLLHYAATHQLKPIALAEFWWGPPAANGDKVQGKFYGACTERCQPLMGFLLSGLSQRLSIATHAIDPSLPILYEDEWLIAVDKPAGLLSVPGRYSDRQDSVLSRLRVRYPDQIITAIHRLDQDTSGILLLARDRQTDRQLRQQFQQRQVDKVYVAILSGVVQADHGTIDLPLWSNPGDRPYQKVNWQHGKPSLTHFQVFSRTEHQTRIKFMPVTGRTHQLRVHAADQRGLGMPIWGDRLYGDCAVNRLYLHAKELGFQHPQSRQHLCLQAAAPF